VRRLIRKAYILFIDQIRKVLTAVITFAVILAIYAPDISCQLYINEFLASNATIIEDTDYGEYSDWIEIYNAGPQPVNLNGYYITDNLDNPEKWQITQNVTVSAGGYILIWADGNNSGLHTSYKLAQEGEEIGLFSPGRALIDSVTYKLQTTDISHGRKSDGSPEWAYFTEPTPGTGNFTSSYNGMVENVPDFSVTGGLYTAPVVTELSTFPGGTIRYTTDGSEPGESSPLYSSPINIGTTTIIRARVFKANLVPGPVVTHTYFINEDIEQGTLPVVSLASDPDNFWDPQDGIYVQDFKPEWEVPVNIELFENNGSDRAAFSQPAGTKVNGLNSWRLPQKSLGIYFRKEYGDNKLEYPLFFDRDRSSYKSFTLRSSGSDWSYTMFRDALAQNSTRPNMNVDMQGYRPCVVYINGQYMGIHNIRSKTDDDYVEKNFGMEPGTFDLIENEDVVEAGDLDAYNEFEELVSHDLSVQSNYNAVAEIMDIEEFTDFVITEIYVRNTSIDHNIFTWKPKESGKWRWILIDMDRGFFSPDNYLISSFINQNVIPLGDLMDNAGYRVYFGRRMADHLYTTFHPQRMNKIIDEHKQAIEQEMPAHIERWLGTTSSWGNAMPSLEYWYGEVNDLKTFAETRPQYLLNDLRNYGFSETASLWTIVTPEEGGYVKLNGLTVPGSCWSGPYPKDLMLQFTAVEKPGYAFQGWAQSARHVIIPRGSVWKYLDNGSDQGSTWRETGFNDSGWQSGPAELGYGDGDESTTVSYGSNSNNKYITTYFRHSFSITEEDLSEFGFMINILRDDGAVVYVNGQEVIRTNMPGGSINYQTTAVSSISGSAESQFTSYDIDKDLFVAGTNVIAVEIHQSSSNSSDIGFDLELVSRSISTQDYITTSNPYSFTLVRDSGIVAVFEPTGQCLLPSEITGDIILDKDCSPYLAQGDITIHENVTVTIESGVEIWMPEGASIFINGCIFATGTADEPVIFKLNPSYSGSEWGALCFINTTAISCLTYVEIEGASEGPVPIRDMAAISAFNANLLLDHMTIENVYSNPVAARYSDVVLTNSSLHSEVTGDLINVKYGHALIENCVFWGNDKEDTDAIDFDDIQDGIIRNCKIYNFFGLNSDAVDIGEKAVNIHIDSLLVYDITDKGVSVGQKSSARITNSTFVNCNMGLGLKDSCHVTVDHCTFYSNATAIACFEKNAGSAGGNAVITNCILSNCSDASYFVDGRSAMNISFSLADNDALPAGPSNLFDDPLFVDPTEFNFRLKPSSPCKNAGISQGLDTDMGSLFYKYSGEPSLMFSGIFYNPRNDDSKTEFLAFYNPGSATIDISGYKITEGVDFTFPEGTLLEAGKSYIVSKYPDVAFTGDSWSNHAHWEAGNLANEGEPLKLENKYGMVIDYLHYQADNPWPFLANAGDVLILAEATLDNHFPYNWTVADYDDLVVSNNESKVPHLISIYPNPAMDIIYIKAPQYSGNYIDIYTVTGQLVARKLLDVNGFASIDLSSCNNSLLVLKVGDAVEKIVLIRP
jgi:hypothetical protein